MQNNFTLLFLRNYNVGMETVDSIYFQKKNSNSPQMMERCSLNESSPCIFPPEKVSPFFVAAPV